MKQQILFSFCLAVFFFFNQTAAEAQVIIADQSTDRAMTGKPIFSHGLGYAGTVMFEGEEIPWFVLSDIYILNTLKFKSKAQARKYYKIANNIKKVYPIALEIQHTIDSCVSHLEELPNKKEKDAYLKVMEKNLMKQYKPRLKKLTFSQGKLLIKLIDRQCDMTSYQLIKNYMGKFKAGLWNTFASIFGASLKKEYDPEVDDRLTERCILLIESGQM